MKIDIENPKTRKMIGICILLLAVLLVGILVKSLLPGKEPVENENPQLQEELKEQQREAMIKEIDANANDVKDIEPEKAKQIMGLEVVIPEELSKLYLDGKTERLKSEMEDFLVEYDFYTDVTKAVCTQVITRDYKKEISLLEFKLNDRARTILTLEYHSHNGKMKFNFY